MKNSNNKVIGIRETVKMLKKGKVSQIILAKDTDEELKDLILNLCRNGSVPVEEIESRAELGHQNGIERPATVVAILVEA